MNSLYTDLLYIKSLLWIHLSRYEPLRIGHIPEDTTTTKMDMDSEQIPTHEKKKLERLFPKPRTRHSIPNEVEAEYIKKIERHTNAPLQGVPSFAKPKNGRWRLVSLLHPETAPSSLHDFVLAFSTALREKLHIDMDRPWLPFSDIERDPVEALAIGDGQYTLFIGEKRHLSSVQKFLATVSVFKPKVVSGFTPCLFLGLYFETPCLFLPIDDQSVREKSFKHAVWNLMKQLRAQ